MAHHYEKGTGDIVIDEFYKGIASSPHQGIASIRNANISTELGEVMCNYRRIQQSPKNNTFTLSAQDSSTIKFPDTDFVPYINQTLKLSSSTISGLSNGIYWIEEISAHTGGFYFVNLSSAYDEANHSQTIDSGWGSTGTVTATLLGLTSTPVAGVVETYFNGTVLEYRYYIAETAGYVWVLDTAYSLSNWYAIDSNALVGINGMGYYNGHLHLFRPNAINFKLTCILGLNPTNPSPNTPGYGTHGMSNFLNSSPNSFQGVHFCLNGHAGFYFTDENFVASIIAALPNIFINFAYGQYTASGTTITVNPLFAGSFPIVGQTIAFYTDNTIFGGVAIETVYYVKSASTNNGTFTVSTTIGGSAISFSGGAGNQYFCSYDPTNGIINGTSIGSSNPTYIGTPQACILPFFETATALAELGINLVIGTRGFTLYIWDEGLGGATDITPQTIIIMDESNCQFLLAANNTVFDFRGQKGNIHAISNSAASLVFSLPDYLSGIPGTPSSYIEPYFSWGQAFIQRSRVFFSVSDNNGNAGGIYSLIPSFFNSVTGQDAGLSLRLENYNSYNTYNGLASVLLNNQNQNTNGIQYISAWGATIPILGTLYGIDSSDTTPYTNGATIIETDIIPTGTLLGAQKKTLSNVELKFAAPLASGESVTINYRTNLTSAWVNADTSGSGANTYYDGGNSTGAVSMYISPVPFSNTQWIQLQIILTSTATNPTFVRLTEIRLRTT